jgi:hypothetical protein
MIRHLRKARVCKDGVRRQPHKHERNAADLIEAQAAEIARLREAIAGPEAWLDSWAKHVGNCQGGYVCTCGLTLAQSELSAALAQVTP